MGRAFRPPARTLADLLAALDGPYTVQGDRATSVTGVSHDSRDLQPGEVFVAMPGFHVDGHAFIPNAIARGASVIVAQIPPAIPLALPLVLVSSTRAALADLATAFYDVPSRSVAVVGVTGTDGKTSTAQLVSAILEAKGLRTGWLSTINTKIGADIRTNTSSHTTPEAPAVQHTLAEMVAAEVAVAVLEVSSHALALDRVRGTQFRVGVFTNLSPEHLNFHETVEAYAAAKAGLFALLPPDGVAVLNADDPYSAVMREATRAAVTTYSVQNPADIWATDIALSAQGTTFTVYERHADGSTSAPVMLTTRLIGQFNVANWLAAYGAARVFGAGLDDLRHAVEHQFPIAGRMSLVQAGQPFLAVVDFAHTPQGLAHALETLRRVVPGRLFLTFGLPGGRDYTNRTEMGQLAAAHTDYFVITLDDAYGDDPQTIAEHIAAGAQAAGATEGERFSIDLDRRAAIRAVLRRATTGDAVLVAGHGHIESLDIGTHTLPWSDAAVVAEELHALGYGASSRAVFTVAPPVQPLME